MDYVIGQVIAVKNSSLTIQLADHKVDVDGTESGVDDNMIINLPSNDGPLALMIGQPGGFVEVSIPQGRLLCMVTEIQMNPVLLHGVSKNTTAFTEYPVLQVQRTLEAIPIGTFDVAGVFERGTDFLPTIGSLAYAVTSEKIKKVYSSNGVGDLPVGQLSVVPEQRAFININTFIGRHAAILGQTGGGKSWAVSSILQKIIQLPRTTIILLDLHGEYEDVFGSDAAYLSGEDIELPYWLMNFEELVNLFIDRGEREAPNQIAMFRQILQKYKENSAHQEQLGLPKVTLDTPIYFDVEKVIDELRSLDTAMEPGAQGKLRHGPFYGHFTRMITRVESRLNDKRYDLIFKPKRFRSSNSLVALMERILGEGRDRKKVTVIDVSSIPFDVRASVISLLLRVSFEFAYWHRRALDKAYPIYVVCDEAHIYLNDKDPSQLPARLAAERIAKEGRKYGVGLLVTSQRPRDLSATILSQCNTFICMRLTNPDDQSYVRALLPDSLRGIADVFAALRRGEAMFLGEAVTMPTRIKLDRPNPAPNSNDIIFTEIWGDAIDDVNIETVVDEWRRQGVSRIEGTASQ
ncbi:ATP-binding protein [Alicyclobacillus acidocaldarius]|uniref:Helicase HerA central domain-containing protein n=1 Tax=Alicyclobacillus acidocaldarius subsp. acidocaldarius (strain ATCC 27009 / DSM 446 / BCRC 14685 / JCM 5260 / KCTC 1825 / NBRC 15652 / NCIMB 11725 / NRRL B-14509 / 104-IA) TaxID=521098 RepID=C8WVZ5_ALIAD|nr:ATP-binding protein [Alicyclobacillus acidocaldarius]ACV58267.1 protein of unknown function DUF87 [Alicyclobacillus acidocaldarius subsp. acidocaldarius DSM 446]